MNPTEIRHCPTCGSTMAHTFRPREGYRCIVCDVFYPENPKELAKLTPQEEGAWNFAWEYYMNELMEEKGEYEGIDDDAGKLAWGDLQQEFPRLRSYEGVRENPFIRSGKYGGNCGDLIVREGKELDFIEYAGETWDFDKQGKHSGHGTNLEEYYGRECVGNPNKRLDDLAYDMNVLTTRKDWRKGPRTKLYLWEIIDEMNKIMSKMPMERDSENPYVKMSAYDFMEKVFQKVKEVYPALLWEDFRYAYNMAIASMPDRKARGLKTALRGMTGEEKEDIKIQILKTDWEIRAGDEGHRIFVNDSHTVAFAEKFEWLMEFIKIEQGYDRYEIVKEFKSNYYNVYKFQHYKKLDVVTNIDAKVLKVYQKYFLSAEPHYYGHSSESDFPIAIVHPDRDYAFIMAPLHDIEEPEEEKEPAMTQEQYEKKLRGYEQKIKELDDQINFRYDNMGYFDVNANDLKIKLTKEKKILMREWDKQQKNPDLISPIVGGIAGGVTFATTYKAIEELQKENPSYRGSIRRKVLSLVLSYLEGDLKNKDIKQLKDYKMRDLVMFEIEHAKALRRKWKKLKVPKYSSLKERQEWHLKSYSPYKRQFRQYFEGGKAVNPEPTRERYEIFHDLEVDKVFDAFIPKPEGKLKPVGKIDHIVYVCSKWSNQGDKNKNVSYIHRWKKAKMILAKDSKGNYYIAGKCRIVSSGINDYKKKPDWNNDDLKLPKIPKKVVYLGILPEIKSKGKTYAFTDTILCTDAKGEHLYITELRKAMPTHPNID